MEEQHSSSSSSSSSSSRSDLRPRKIAKTTASSTPSSSSSSASSSSRSWSDLPGLLLWLICDHLASLLDIASFSAVCRSFRSAARLSSGPPLLLYPITKFFRETCVFQTPPRCRMVHPTKSYLGYFMGEPPSLPSPLPPGPLSHHFIGISFGNLIFSDKRNDQILIADAFTGRETRPSPLPPICSLLACSSKNNRGVLTAPPSSPDCLLLVSGKTLPSLFSCRPAGAEADSWSQHPLPDTVSPPIHQVLPFKGRLFALDDAGTVLSLEPSAHPILKPLPAQVASEPMLKYYQTFTEQLVSCSGELLMLRIVKRSIHTMYKVDVHRMVDFGRRAWVKVRNLGDWSVFIDAAGRCPVACRRPARWGGRCNCIYIAGPRFHKWAELDLNVPLIDHHPNSRPRMFKSSQESFPSPIWVYPSMLS